MTSYEFISWFQGANKLFGSDYKLPAGATQVIFNHFKMMKHYDTTPNPTVMLLEPYLSNLNWDSNKIAIQKIEEILNDIFTNEIEHHFTQQHFVYFMQGGFEIFPKKFLSPKGINVMKEYFTKVVDNKYPTISNLQSTIYKINFEFKDQNYISVTLNNLFTHVVDKMYGNSKVQQELNDIHNDLPEIGGSYVDDNNNVMTMRC